MQCGGLKKSRYSIVMFTFLVLWDCRVQHLSESRVALNPGLGDVRDVASAIISHDSIKASLLFSNFGCCISKGTPFRYLISRRCVVNKKDNARCFSV